MRQIPLIFPIIVNKFAQHDNLKKDMLHAIETQEAVEDLVGPNNNIYKCDWHSARFDPNREWLKIFRPNLNQHLIDWKNNFGYDNFVIHEIWFQQYDTNSKHAWHVHGANFTNVYYLDLPEGSPKTEYINPVTKQLHQFDVSEGDIITFPSWLIHRAPINLGKEMKTIISWNMDVTLTDFYGEENGDN